MGLQRAGKKPFVNYISRRIQHTAFFDNFDRYFGTLGIEIAKIRLRIRTPHPRNRLYVNFGKFSYIISLKNNQLACFFGHSVQDCT